MTRVFLEKPREGAFALIGIGEKMGWDLTSVSEAVLYRNVHKNGPCTSIPPRALSEISESLPPAKLQCPLKKESGHEIDGCEGHVPAAAHCTFSV